METPSGLYIIFYLLYLITTLVIIYFLIEYSETPQWVWLFFGASFAFLIMNILIKENYLKCEDRKTEWIAIYGVVALASLILFVTGLILTIIYSIIPWWIWLIIGIGIIIPILGTIIVALLHNYPNTMTIILGIMAFLGFIALVVGLILLIIYSNAPWWIWLLVVLAIIFLLISGMLEATLERKTSLYQEISELFSQNLDPYVENAKEYFSKKTFSN